MWKIDEKLITKYEVQKELVKKAKCRTGSKGGSVRKDRNIRVRSSMTVRRKKEKISRRLLS